eukprot:4221172-Pyramimonas_sp.AAC.1
MSHSESDSDTGPAEGGHSYGHAVVDAGRHPEAGTALVEPAPSHTASGPNVVRQLLMNSLIIQETI